jgi:hypothetical protein
MAIPQSITKGYVRLGNFPMDDTFVFQTKALLDTYADSHPTVYAGQICSVVENGLLYILKAKPLGASGFVAEQIGSSGAVAGHTQDISSITGLQDALDSKQIKTVYSDTAPTHSPGLEWVDTTELRSYRSYNNRWVEIDHS